MTDQCATLYTLSVDQVSVAFQMESFQFVSAMRSYVTSAGSKAPFKQSGTQQVGKGKCREGRSVGYIAGAGGTLGSEPYFTSSAFPTTTTLSCVVFV